MGVVSGTKLIVARITKRLSSMAKTVSYSPWTAIYQICSLVCQVTLTVVAVYGYFYTVKPLYENATLKRELRLQIVSRLVTTVLSDCSRPWNGGLSMIALPNMKEKTRPFQRNPHTTKSENVFAECTKTVISNSETSQSLAKLSDDDKRLINRLLENAYTQAQLDQTTFIKRFARVEETYKNLQMNINRKLIASLATEGLSTAARRAAISDLNGQSIMVLTGTSFENEEIKVDYARSIRKLCTELMDQFANDRPHGR